MKKAFVVILLVGLGVGGWMTYQYTETGVWSVLPVTLTENEKGLRKVKQELVDVQVDIRTQERIAGTAGVASSPGLNALFDKRIELEKSVLVWEAAVEKEKAAAATPTFW